MAKIVKFITIPISNVIVPEHNARVYYTELLEKSIREFGFVEPLIVDEQFNLVCGLQRYIVAKRIGMTEVPCIVVGFTKNESDKFRLVANKVGEKSNWDWCKLNNELKRIGDNLERYELTDEDEDSQKIIEVYFQSTKFNQQSLF